MVEKLPQVVVSAWVEKAGKILLVKEVLESGRELWIFPGGHVEFGEELHSAVKREMKEELGLEVETGEFLGFKEAIFPQYGYHTIIFFYRATPAGGELSCGDGILDARFFSREELKELKLVETARWLLQKQGWLE